MMQNPGGALRRLWQSGQPVVAPTVYDPLSARLTEKAGFPAVTVGGWATGAHLATTEPLMTMTEQIDVAGRMARSVGIPLICDGHTGYGEPIHVMRTVREYEEAGIAAIHIEDQLFPKRMHYHAAHQLKHVIPVEEAVAKYRAALEARTNPDFVIIARTDARYADNGGLSETIRRLEAYARAGVDVLMPMVLDPDEAREVREAIPEVPMLWMGGLGNMGVRELSIDEVRQMGYEIIIYPLAFILTAGQAVYDLLLRLRETGKCELPDFAGSRKLVEEAIDISRFLEIERNTTERQ